ncbi:MAG: hypothetical protein IT177_19750 [Acidobacteria bacterium]|nr:hypothetical protein [Acidobacteriota bacterium]
MPASLRLLISIAAVTATAACGAARAPLTTSFAQLPDHLNVGDTVTVESADGAEVRGRLVRMAPDSIAVTEPSAERMVDASRVRRISACCDSLLNGTLIGFVSGALFGTAVAVGLSDGSSDLDGNQSALIFGGIGAGLGIGLDALVRSDRLVYSSPAVTPRARAGPTGAAVGITVTW